MVALSYWVSRIDVIVIAVLLLFSRQDARAGGQEWHWAVSQGLTGERVLGLLNLPDIVGSECTPVPPARVELHDSPSKGRPAIGSIEPPRDCRPIVRRVGDDSEEELPTDESGYETPAAIVYQRADLWFRIALQRGSAWVVRDEPGDFLPYPELLEDRLSYLRPGWDGRLWDTPGAAGTATPLPPGWTRHVKQDVPIECLGSRRVSDEVWIQVRLVTERCGESLEEVSPVSGWVPAYRPSDAPAAWFYSRGC